MRAVQHRIQWLALLAVLTCLLAPAAFAQAIGEVEFSRGVGFAQSPGEVPRTLGKGLALKEGDRLTTSEGGSAIIKLADGKFYVGEYADGYTADWRESDIPIQGMRWRQFDSKTALTTGAGLWVPKVDLSRVDEVGFTDLMAGAGHGAGGSSRISWIEVYGKPVKRDAAPAQSGANR